MSPRSSATKWTHRKDGAITPRVPLGVVGGDQWHHGYPRALPALPWPGRLSPPSHGTGRKVCYQERQKTTPTTAATGAMSWASAETGVILPYPTVVSVMQPKKTTSAAVS